MKENNEKKEEKKINFIDLMKNKRTRSLFFLILYLMFFLFLFSFLS